MAETMLTKNGALVTPQNSTIAIYYVTATGHTRKANISGQGNKFVALFEEDDVDFFLRIINSNNIGRNFRYRVTVCNDEYGFVVQFGESSDLKAVQSYGKHLHFISESNREGQRLARKMASKLSISPDAAADVMSVLKFNVAYSAIEEQSIYVRGYDVSNPRLSPFEFVAVSTETVSDLKKQIIKKWPHISGKKFELFYDGTTDVIDESLRIDRIENRRTRSTVKIIFTESVHQEPFSVVIRNKENGKIVFNLAVTSFKPTSELRKEIWDAAPDQFKEACDVHMNYGKVGLTSGFLMGYGIGPGMVIDYYIGPIQIFVKLLFGQTSTLTLFESDKIETMRGLIAVREKYPINELRLIFSGKQLEDGSTLNDNNVHSHSTIHLCMRLRGGDASANVQDRDLLKAPSLSHDLVTQADIVLQPAVVPQTVPEEQTAVPATLQVAETSLNVKGDRNSEASDRGLVCFGRATDEKFVPCKFNKDRAINIPRFVIELRLARTSAISARRSSRLMAKAQMK